MIERRIAAGDLAGAVTIVARRGKVAHLAAQGVMDLDTKQPMTPATMFRIASMTKPVIGVSIMMLVEENKLRLNDPVARYIPEFANMKVAVARPGSGGSEGPGFYTVPAQRPITIKDLLTHVSGLGSGPMGNSDIEKVARKDGETLAQYIPRLGGTALEFQPGSRWTYSPGAGFETLGRIIEIASGLPLDRFFQTRIFDPLGMRDITFWPTDAQWPRVATVYGRQPTGLIKQAMPNDTLSRNVYFRGSGGLVQQRRGLRAARPDAGQWRRVERQAAPEPQVGGDAERRPRGRHAARTSGRRRLWPERPRRHQSRRARHAAVGRHLWLVRRAGHPLLRGSEGTTGWDLDGPDAEQRQ